jgi:hypothetical protein
MMKKLIIAKILISKKNGMSLSRENCKNTDFICLYYNYNGLLLWIQKGYPITQNCRIINSYKAVSTTNPKPPESSLKNIVKYKLRIKIN